MEFGLDIIRHKTRRGVPLSGFEARMLDRANRLTCQDLDVLLDVSDAGHPSPRTEPDVRAGLALHALDPTVTVLDGSHSVVCLHAPSHAPDLRRVGLDSWSLYGALAP